MRSRSVSTDEGGGGAAEGGCADAIEFEARTIPPLGAQFSIVMPGSCAAAASATTTHSPPIVMKAMLGCAGA
jgi:hypothetical protein